MLKSRRQIYISTILVILLIIIIYIYDQYFITNENNELLQYLLLVLFVPFIFFAIHKIFFFPAKKDPITGLMSRHAFLQKVSSSLKKEPNNKFVLIFLDIDDFQKINSSLSHHEGDLVLKELAKRLQKVVNQCDRVSISRISGDEFAVFLQLKNLPLIHQIAEELLKEINQIIELYDYQFQVSASIGIAFYPKDGDQAETLLKNAEISMYQAKKEKNNYKLYVPIIKNELDNFLYLESELRKAISNNEFLFYYQPQVNSKTNEITGMEALLRWQHPKHGLITPDKIIPIAEKTNLIVEIGKWGIKAACSQLKEWHSKGFTDLNVSVNLSLVQLKDKNFIDFVKNTITETNTPAKNITFEITENITMDYQSIIPILQELKSLGCCIAIDDFGTGYSSLSYIKKLPCDIIKIDRSFVKDIVQNKESLSIVVTIIDLSKHLGVDLIAEGIETKEQLELLQQKGCQKIQGYYYSKPIPANLFEQTVSNFARILRN